jgi:conjugal transfer pilus assembly protein TrbC
VLATNDKNARVSRTRARLLALAMGVLGAAGMVAAAPSGQTKVQGSPGHTMTPAATAGSGKPDLDRLPQPVQRGAVDLAAVARGFDAAGVAAAAQALANGPQLLVFVSLTMPEGSLRRLIEQGERTRATLVLRGLQDGSMVRTATVVRQLLGKHKTALQIDPQGFDRFSVNQVPTFILLKDGAQLQRCTDASCVPPTSYAEVSGDATIEYALEWIEERSPAFSREAKVLRRRLRE